MINQLKNGIKRKWIKSTMDEPLDLSKKRPGPWDKQLDCEGIDISVEKGKVNIVDIPGFEDTVDEVNSIK